MKKINKETNLTNIAFSNGEEAFPYGAFVSFYTKEESIYGRFFYPVAIIDQENGLLGFLMPDRLTCGKVRYIEPETIDFNSIKRIKNIPLGWFRKEILESLIFYFNLKSLAHLNGGKE